MKKLNLPEEKIICLLKARDKKGFDLLYKLYSGCLYNIALKIVHSREIAEDVLQDSFIKIWKNIDTYNASKGSLFTFILNITRNTAIDKTRSMAYKQERSGLTFDPVTIDQQDCFQPQVDYIGMEQYVKALDSRHQDLVKYVYFQGYTQDEAAKVLEIPLGTAKSRLKAAIGQLRLMVN